jgi:hypothetical protein
MDCATAAGAACVLVPTEQTRVEEIRRAPHCVPDLHAAVDLVLAGLGHQALAGDDA